ncbi:MAG: endonuclease/exonuclease/phosphatase family protein [Sulfuricella sp.]|nr:endonuclease/exonuclease/phosphatase family protein [Sulfuricella sp.]
MSSDLKIVTHNIHKGFSQFNRHMMLHDLRANLRATQADVVFLQEVVGAHDGHPARYANYPELSQYEFLAESVWEDYAYGKNAVYPAGHHGNAILSRYPIAAWENLDVSAHRFEQRGLLHCEIEAPGWRDKLHCLCVHFGLFARGRRRQLAWLRERIRREVPSHAPLVIAGDFNDWGGEACDILAHDLHLTEAFSALEGRPAKSYPAALPLFRLDRIYVRGVHVKSAEVLSGRPWSRISDHAALSATLAPL